MIVLLLAACAPSPADPDVGADDAPTWHQDVAPIVVARCAGCHTSGGIAPFALDDYETAKAHAADAWASVASGAMPPWDALTTDECTPRFGWKDDARLTDEEEATLHAWVDAGAPEGDPATAAPLPTAASVDLPDWNAELRPDVGFAPSGNADQFVCLVLDSGLSTKAWVTGVQVLPDDLTVDHHAVAFLVDSVDDPDGDGILPDCFNVNGTPLGVWVPGSYPNVTPPDSGIPMSPGQKVVIQMHYHPAGADHPADRTGVRLQWTHDRPDHEVLYTGVGNFGSEADGLQPDPDDRAGRGAEFRIPAGLSGHVEEMQASVDGDVRYPLFAVQAHMHLVGTDLVATVTHPDPSVADGQAEECLLHEPAWDFDWQRMYAYDAPLGAVSLGGGDTIHVRCTYDNTLDNPGVVRALGDAGLTEPVDVYLGEQTTDEMCLLIIGVTYDP